MKAFLNRLMSNFVFKAAGSSQRKCTTEPPPQGPLEDMASRRRRNTPNSRKREVSEVNIKPLEPPRKKQRTGNTLSDRSEAIQHSNVVNSELTAMTVASSSDYLSTLDDASVEDILSVAHLLDSTPSRSPTPVLAFDIPSSDDYDVTTPGSSTVLDFDNDDPSDLYPNSSTHICGLFEEPHSDMALQQDAAGICTAYSQEYGYQDLRGKPPSDSTLDSDLDLCVSNLKSLPCYFVPSNESTLQPSSRYEEDVLSCDPLPPTHSESTSWLSSGASYDHVRVNSDLINSFILKVETPPWLDSLDDMPNCSSKLRPLLLEEITVAPRPKDVSPSFVQTEVSSRLASAPTHSRIDPFISSVPIPACQGRLALEISDPQEIPPPIRPPGAVPSRPGTPEPQRPRPVRPGSEAVPTSHVTSLVDEVATIKRSQEHTLPAASVNPVITARCPAIRCKTEPDEPSLAHLSVQAPYIRTNSSDAPVNGLTSTAMKQEFPEERLHDYLQKRIDDVSKTQSVRRAEADRSYPRFARILPRIDVPSLNKSARVSNCPSENDTSDEEPLAVNFARRSASAGTPPASSSSEISSTAKTSASRTRKNDSVAVKTSADPSKTGRKSPAQRSTVTAESCSSQVSMLRDCCQLLWKGDASLFPFPPPCRRTKVVLAMGKTIREAVNFSSAINELREQYPAISNHDEEESGRAMLHPPRPRIYDLDSLIAFKGVCWDINGFVAMELSALPWLAFVENGGRAQEQCLDTLSAGIVGPRGRKWRSCKIETPIEASHEMDLFVYLNSGIALPDWFVSGDSLEIDEEETDLADEESCRSDIVSPFENVHMIC